MSNFIKPWLALAAVAVLAAACRKEVEKIVVQEVEKQTSWAASPGLYGTGTVLVGMSKTASSVLLQSPASLNIITPKPGSLAYRQFGYLGRVLVSFPTDVYLRMPLNADFFVAAHSAQDTLVTLVPTAEPVTTGYTTYVRLRKLDPQAIGITANKPTSGLPFGATNKNNYLLFGYQTAGPTGNLNFALTKVTRQSAGNVTAQTQRVRIALPPALANSQFRWIKAIDDYFLVSCEDAGLYKIREDGSVTRVFAASTLATTCYQWQGKVYVPESDGNILISTTNGDNWQRSQGLPPALRSATYYTVGDSLVGVSQALGPQLFTLNWRGSAYSLRVLRNDGLGQGEVRGLEQLGDTVYAGTTSGLFKQPTKGFFVTKQQ
jgi:hypothetical protein